MQVNNSAPCAFGFRLTFAATLLFAPPAVAGPRNSGSDLRLAQASVGQAEAERQRYEAAAERARAALGAEKPEPQSVKAPPPVRGGTSSEAKDAVCIAGC